MSWTGILGERCPSFIFAFIKSPNEISIIYSVQTVGKDLLPLTIIINDTIINNDNGYSECSPREEEINNGSG